MIKLFNKRKASEKVQKIKKSVKNGTYDWDSAVKSTADKIIEHPETLLWSVCREK